MSFRRLLRPIYLLGFLFNCIAFLAPVDGLAESTEEQQLSRTSPASPSSSERPNAPSADKGGHGSNTADVAMKRPRRLAIPSADSQKLSSDKIRDLFGADNSRATEAESKSKLAAELIAHAIKETSAVDVYVLLIAGKGLAIEAGDVEGCIRAISLTAERFDIDAETEKLTALRTMASKAPPGAIKPLVQTLIDLSITCGKGGDLNEAIELAQLAAAAARRSKDPQLQKLAAVNLTDARKLQKQENQLKTYTERLVANPRDSEAAEEVGRFRCFVQQRWDVGIPLLALGGNTELAQLAQNQLATVGDNRSLIKVADDWWDWGIVQKGAVRSATLRHAAELYERDLALAAGLEKLRLEKRIQEAALQTESHEKPVFLADLKEADVANATFGFSKNGTYAGQPFICGGQQWPKSIAAIPGDSATATVKYDLPNPVSRIQGRVGIFAPATAKPGQKPATAIVFQIASGGKVLWSSAPIGELNASAPFRVELTGLKSFELRTVCDGSAACAWAGWLDPQLVP
jgi:hypothetical protein